MAERNRCRIHCKLRISKGSAWIALLETRIHFKCKAQLQNVAKGKKERWKEGKKAKEEGPVSLRKDECAVYPWPALGH